MELDKGVVVRHRILKKEATEKGTAWRKVQETLSRLAAAEQTAADLSERAQKKEAELVAEAQMEKEARQAEVKELKEELRVEKEGGAKRDKGAQDQVPTLPERTADALS